MSSSQADRDYQRVAAAIEFVRRHVARQPRLADVAAHVGSSPHHFQRMFKRWAGVSPKRFLQSLSADHARACLRDAANVLDAAYDAGLSGPGRLHDLLVAVDAVTPGEVRRLGAGLEIRHGVHASPFGRAHVATTARGVCHLAFLDGSPRDPDTTLRAAWPQASVVHDPSVARDVIRRIFERDGDRPLPLLLRGTNLQVQVWRALLRIPRGAVVSYGGLARALGRPTAARAVAGAVGANPVAWLIPCHRVLRANGAVGGYRWGPTRKRAMLARELTGRELLESRPMP